MRNLAFIFLENIFMFKFFIKVSGVGGSVGILVMHDLEPGV